MKNEAKLTLSVIACILSFMLGYSYAHRENFIENRQHSEAPLYIDISKSSKTLKIQSLPENVYFRIDGELFQTGSIRLE
jgi:hypothetical protein